MRKRKVSIQDQIKNRVSERIEEHIDEFLDDLDFDNDISKRILKSAKNALDTIDDGDFEDNIIVYIEKYIEDCLDDIIEEEFTDDIEKRIKEIISRIVERRLQESELCTAIENKAMSKLDNKLSDPEFLDTVSKQLLDMTDESIELFKNPVLVGTINKMVEKSVTKLFSE